ncbi:TrmH family RNA methyltransferase [Chryseobacterium sp.]|uniref:TrmH family RNA methyltransferase n=1 Tax=Chryseobacterium sp. TaxID=1871047 RepID=UPI0012AA86C9|nr:RNA methyltransferase [Chryseobacterium sp.]QFG53173.1 RNA methyltransferase [Chryseobacterium sp.]
MVTAHTIKILQSLDKKKYRQKHGLFVVEGNKNIRELQSSRYKIREIFSINPSELLWAGQAVETISEQELRKISFLQHPRDSVALVEIPEAQFLPDINLQLVLDGIQDPGNFGTIIRLADWFGIEQVVCSDDTVDQYNPKAVMSAMGSFSRVNVVYTDIKAFLSESPNVNLGTDMEGESIYSFVFPERMNIVLGNEGSGMRPETESLIRHQITIPRFGTAKATESLNVSMAAGIILGQIFSAKEGLK